MDTSRLVKKSRPEVVGVQMLCHKMLHNMFLKSKRTKMDQTFGRMILTECTWSMVHKYKCRHPSNQLGMLITSSVHDVNDPWPKNAPSRAIKPTNQTRQETNFKRYHKPGIHTRKPLLIVVLPMRSQKLTFAEMLCPCEASKCSVFVHVSVSVLCSKSVCSDFTITITIKIIIIITTATIITISPSSAFFSILKSESVRLPRD